MNLMISLEKTDISDSEGIHKMQVVTFKAQLDKYQDFDINPGAETLEHFQSRFDYADVDHYLIQCKDESIGYVRVKTMEGRVFKLSALFILPTYQGKGYAQQAIEQAEKLYPQAERWMLNTIKQEPSLCCLYEKMGYAPIGEENVSETMDLVKYEKVPRKLKCP